MEILCFGIAQIDPLLGVGRDIIPLDDRQAAPLLRFRHWHESNMVGIPTRVNPEY